MLATGGEDGALHLWNVSQQQLARINTTQHDVVRLIYFLSKDRPPAAQHLYQTPQIDKTSSAFLCHPDEKPRVRGAKPLHLRRMPAARQRYF